MKFHIEHTFTGTDLTMYENIYMSERFNVALMPVAALKSREQLEHRDEGERVFRRIRVVPDRQLPAMIKKFVAGDLVSEEESWFDKTKHCIDWKQKLSILPGKLKVSGSIQFVPVAGGCKRVLTGEVDVDVFGVGKLIEKAVVENIRETYDKIAAFTQTWINEGQGA